MWRLYKEIAASAIPASIGSFLNYFTETINLITIGQLGNPVLVAAVGMGNIMMTTTGIGMFIGMNSAMETLVSQAYGANNLELCGIYLWRGRIGLLILFTFVWLIFCLSGMFLELVG